jgi:lipopolysaccharide biosynthesis protein
MKILARFFSNITLSMLRFYDDLIIFSQKLRPRTYVESLRILELNESSINHGDNVCIFIVYERGYIPDMTWNAIKSIKAMGIKVFLVVNSKLVEEEKDKVREISDFSMFRNNTGKDIGGYKDAYLYLHKQGYLKLINKLVFANDSVIYPQKYIKEIFEKLVSSKAGMTGYSHVQEIHYHIQSFLFSCDKNLINDKLFIKFWNKYLPIDRRRYMIHKGEVGITKAVLKTGLKIEILNDISEILNQELTIEKLYTYVTNLPTRSSLLI